MSRYIKTTLSRISPLIFLIGLSTSYASVEQRDEWFKCQRNSDCALKLAFCGEKIGVNKKFLREYDEWYATHKARCESGRIAETKNAVVCAHEKCTSEFFSKSVSLRAGDHCAKEGDRTRGKADGAMFLGGKAGDVETDLVCQSGRWVLSSAP
jgi:hypothetical protein